MVQYVWTTYNVGSYHTRINLSRFSLWERRKNLKEKGYYIFRTWITKNGVKYYAKNYGKRAFRIFIRVNSK